MNPLSTKNLLFLLGMWLFSLSLSAAINPPKISCLEVLPDGSVIISWTDVDNTVDQQNIFFSNDNGNTYTRVGFLDIYNPGISSFHHTTANANNQILYYYVEVVYPTETQASAPARTMRLFAIENIINPGIIQLSWNDMQPDDLSYEIWQEYPIGDWHIIGTTNRTLFNDTLQNTICDDTVTYRIEVDNPIGCRSVSSITGGRYSETRSPTAPTFDSITVNDADQVVLSWDPSTSPDARSTIVYLNDFEIARILITEPNQMYVDLVSDPCQDPNLIYALATVDQCGNKSPIEDDRKLSPVFLHTPQTSICEEVITLQWNPYINANPPLSGYQVLYSINGDPFVVAANLSTNTSTYTHEDVLPASTYTYAIRALFSGGSSSSCQKEITTGSYIKPNFIYLANASVLPSAQTELTIDIDLSPIACQWQVWRNTSTTSPELITSFSRAEVTTTPFVFTDPSAEGNQQPYNYQVTVLDSCGKENLFSNNMTTMWLTGTALSDVENQLQWTAFDGFEAGIKHYRIYRMTGTTLPLQPIDSVLPNTLEYTDNIAGLPITTGITTYWIEAEENTVNTYGYQENSLSNRVSLAQETDLFLPNAFHPNGINNTFKPVFLFFNGQSYLFQVYNRWGQIIYETNEADLGWDGTIKSKTAPTGTYLYRLIYTDFSGKTTKKRGAFTLVR